MKRIALVVLVLACQKQEDPSASTTATASASATTTASAATIASAVLTPVDDPLASASAAASVAPRDAGSTIDDARRAALAKQAEAMQLKMLKAFNSTPPPQGVLNRSDIPPDVSVLAGPTDNSGLHVSGGGAIVPGHRGSLSALGARDH
jgi:hypothetical protein